MKDPLQKWAKDTRKREYRKRGWRDQRHNNKYQYIGPLSAAGRPSCISPEGRRTGPVPVIGTAVVRLTHADRLAYKVEVGVRGLFLKFREPKDKYDNVPVYYVGYPFLKKFIEAHIAEKGVECSG